MSVDKQQKTSEAGEVFMASLSQRARDKLLAISAGPLAPAAPVETVDEDGETEFRAFAQTLSPAAKRALSLVPEPAPAHEVAAEKATNRYGVVEATDGEYAQLRLFKNAEALARRLQQIDGTDTVVWCFYGVPLAFTKGPQRYLELPGGKQMIQIPMFEGGPAPIVQVSDEPPGLKGTQETGYIGPPELAHTTKTADKVTATGGGDGDDDEDDEG